MISRLQLGNKQWNNGTTKSIEATNVLRWYNYVKAADFVQKALSQLPAEAVTALSSQTAETTVNRSNATRAQEGKFVDLPEAEYGKVVVRFPPEASGLVTFLYLLNRNLVIRNL